MFQRIHIIGWPTCGRGCCGRRERGDAGRRGRGRRGRVGALHLAAARVDGVTHQRAVAGQRGVVGAPTRQREKKKQPIIPLKKI